MPSEPSRTGQPAAYRRRLPIGPEVVAGGVHFRVWAPAASRVEVVPAGRGEAAALEAEDEGYWSGLASLAPGARYRLRLNGRDEFPDPASAFQPEGPNGPSEVVDHASFRWSDRDWRGVRNDEAVLYELHVGTFTAEGTWSAAAARLPELASLGVTVIEMMPVGEYAGSFGWGYDGVDWFAPSRLYGRPKDLMSFVDSAHARGIAVILDVVYNHFGPVGNYLPRFSKDYVSRRYRTDWGPAINFDGPNSAPVRELVLANVRHWIERYHFDGLRLDATQNVYDLSAEHILAAISRTARAAAPGRSLLLIAENEPQRSRLLRPLEEGGYGFDAVWSDDFHHSAEAALTGRREGYFRGYRGSPQELVSAVKRGFLYQGQHLAWQRKRRGTPAWELAPGAFVHYLENHDQVGNAPGSRRLLDRCAPGGYRAMMAVLLLGPQIPLLFQGSELGSRSPFPFFADPEPGLAPVIHEGRRDFISLFASLATPEARRLVPPPSDVATFRLAKLSPTGDRRMTALVKDLLRLRREDPVFRARVPGSVDGAVLGPEAFCLRWHAVGDRLLVVNLGIQLELAPIAEPLLAPPQGRRWRVLWSSEDPAYGGFGTPPLEDPGWALPARAAVALMPEPNHLS